jgi:alpha-L-fucosidase
MKTFERMVLLLAVGVFPFLRASAATEKSLAVQRADGCVVMDAGQAQVEGNRSTFGFELTHPGEYTVQVITRIEDSTSILSATVVVNGKPLCDSLTKAYAIEEGVVSEFEKPATFTEAGRHTLSLRSTVAPVNVRLVPQIYTKSRIHISSSKYYDAWLAMHRSPEKQAALARFQQARFGMFIHWGVYSVAAGSWKGVKIEDSSIRGPRVAEWLMFTFNIPRQEYREFAKQFNPDKSFAANIAWLAKETGMQYVVITSKHHDGFGLFESACSDFDVTDACPYDGDLIKELHDACRAEGLDFGVYYSHGHDWMDGSDANYAKVKKLNDTIGVPTRPNGKNLWDPSPNPYFDYLENKAYPQIAELIALMPDLSLIWFDGEGLISEAQAFRFYKMIYDLNPGIIVNRRIGYDFGDYIDAGDNKTPAAKELVAKHFETCGTGNHSWGFKAHDHKWKSTNELLRNFVDIVSKGGNYLLNIGPDGKGHVPDPCVASFRELGIWVKTNADAIFGTTRWTTFTEGVTNVKSASSAPTEFWFSAREDKVYAMSLVPGTDRVRIRSLRDSAGKVTHVRLLGSDRDITWVQDAVALELDFGSIETGDHGYAVEIALETQDDNQLLEQTGGMK